MSSNTLLSSLLPSVRCAFWQSEHGHAKGSVHLSQGVIIYGSTSTQLLINCCCKRGKIIYLPFQDEPFSRHTFSVKWIVIRIRGWSDDRVSSDTQSYQSRKTAWTIIPSGEDKAPVVGSCLVGCTWSLNNVLFAIVTELTRYSPLALELAVWSKDVTWALTSEQITSCTFESGWSSDIEIPVLGR